MAILSDHGAHCAVAACNQQDFLPFTCDCCSRVFCKEHFKYADHNCEKALDKDSRALVCMVCEQGVKVVPGEDPNETLDRHMRNGCPGRAPDGLRAKKPRCPVSGCKQVLTFSNKVQCGKCRMTTCLKHRFEEDHCCRGACEVAATPMADRIRSLSRLVLAF